MDEHARGLATGLGALAAILVAAAVVPIRDWLGSAGISLLLAIVVVVAATFGGRLAGVVTSVTAALAFDFFHTKPYYELRIDKREDLIAAVLLLVLGFIVGELAVLTAQSRRSALIHARSASRLEDVAAVVAAGAKLSEVWPVVRRSLIDELQLAECRFEPVPFVDPLLSLERGGRIDSDELHYEPGGFALPAEGVAVPVTHAGRLLGRLVLVPTPHHGTSRAERRAAVAMADQLAVAASRTAPLMPLG